MPKQRGNGEGMFRKRISKKTGKITWEARFTIISGEPPVSFYGDTKTEAKEKAQHAMLLYEQGKSNSLDKRESKYIKYKVKEWFPFFIFKFKYIDETRKTVEYSSARAYASTYVNHIEPAFGEDYMDEVHPMKIKNLIDSVVTPTSTRTAEYIMTVLQDGYKTAVNFNYAKVNPTIVIKMPQKRAEESKAMNYAQEKHFLDNLNLLDDKDKLILYIPLSTGLGAGEELGIEWSNILLDKKIFKIKHSVKSGKKGSVLGNTKTKYRVRNARFNDKTKKMLEKIPASERIGFLFKGHNKDKTLNPNKHMNVGYPTHLFRKYADSIGLVEFNFYDLRHTFATRCKEKGLNKLAVRYQMGHGSSKMLDKIYEHENDDFLDYELKKLDTMFNQHTTINTTIKIKNNK